MPLRFPEQAFPISLFDAYVSIQRVFVHLISDPYTLCSSLFNSDIMWFQQAIAGDLAGACSFLVSGEFFQPGNYTASRGSDSRKEGTLQEGV